MEVDSIHNRRVSKVLNGLRIILSFCYYTGCTPFKLKRVSNNNGRYYLHTNRVQKVKLISLPDYQKQIHISIPNYYF